MPTPNNDLTEILTEAERQRRADRAAAASSGTVSTPMATGDYTVQNAGAVNGGGNVVTLDADGFIPAQYLRPVTAAGVPTYNHTQTVPSTTWAIAHNLGGRPAPVIVDDAGVLMHLVDVYYPDDNHLVAKFGRARSGTAYLTL